MTNKEKKPKTQTTPKRQRELSEFELEYKQQVKDGVVFSKGIIPIKKRDQNKA